MTGVGGLGCSNSSRGGRLDRAVHARFYAKSLRVARRAVITSVKLL
jgi:hypothetical protein